MLVLFLSSMLLLQLTGGMTFTSLAKKIPSNDSSKLQAKYLAEAGVWLTIEKWEELGEIAAGTHSYSLPNGVVETSIRATSPGVIELRSIGYVSPHFKDKLLAIYDLSAKKILDWNRQK
ncbi:hypothetical protein [Ammoniphilus sp. YIM 78166]|uniref:hypothetical protein n=1 Tax=Ammoniphilus sp. YIM 78166 TaxID=1644106 RepID=UPI00106FA77E|nr:hypothetical protein [Ammoniphilus sp. YIM 78166]